MHAIENRYPPLIFNENYEILQRYHHTEFPPKDLFSLKQIVKPPSLQLYANCLSSDIPWVTMKDWPQSFSFCKRKDQLYHFESRTSVQSLSVNTSIDKFLVGVVHP